MSVNNSPRRLSLSSQGALIDATNANNIAAVKDLLSQGADINAPGLFGSTALMKAALNDNLEIARLLIDKGAALDKKNQFGNTALMLAANNGHTEIACLLIEKGAALDEQNNEGNTALIMAVRQDAAGAVRLLIEKGADLEIKNKSGLSARESVSSAFTDVWKMLNDAPNLRALEAERVRRAMSTALLNDMPLPKILRVPPRRKGGPKCP